MELTQHLLLSCVADEQNYGHLMEYHAFPLESWKDSNTLKSGDWEPAFSQVSLNRLLHKWYLAQI